MDVGNCGQYYRYLGIYRTGSYIFIALPDLSARELQHNCIQLAALATLLMRTLLC